MNIKKFKSIAEKDLLDSLVVENQQTVVGGSWIRRIGAALLVALVAGPTDLHAPGTETGDCTCNTDGCK